MFYTIFIILHLFGMVLGAGAAFMSDFMFFTSLKDKIISRDEFSLLTKASHMVWAGLLLSTISGVGLFALNIDTFSSSEKFISKTIIVGIIIANGIVFHIFHLPFLKKHVNKKLATKSDPISSPIVPAILLSGVISVTSWTSVIILGGLRGIVAPFSVVFSIYSIIIFLGFLSSWYMFHAYTHHSLRHLFIKITSALAVCVLVFVSIFLFTDKTSLVTSLDTSSKETVESFSMAEVYTHNKTNDCWLVIDGLVFDATPAAKLHPALFNCGTDASANYHKNHGPTISDKMMQYHIGTLDTQSTSEVEITTTPVRDIQPITELYVDSLSWDPRQLMVIVEKDAENLLFIDGSTHQKIGRVLGVGYQPHTSVFSSDLTYMYIISRDGWILKIDVRTLETVNFKRVGENSRGTALSDDGKYLAIGNYEPHNVVILDADTLETKATIETIGEKDGKALGSRVGGLVESGNDFIATMKDLNSVWVIGQDENNTWVAKNKYNNIGGNTAPLHDAYLTPDGKFFIVAAQKSNSVWVLDTSTWTPVGEVPTGKLPHTGPGATWGTTTYVPALEEGLITAIDTTTWKPIASIPTGGPGLFVRSYHRNDDYHYVWADTAFGDHADEIYVIDAKTNTIIKTLYPVKGKNSWHPEFTYDGSFVYVVSQEGNMIVVYDAHTFKEVKKIPASTPSAVSNIGLRIEEPGL